VWHYCIAAEDSEAVVEDVCGCHLDSGPRWGASRGPYRSRRDVAGRAWSRPLALWSRVAVAGSRRSTASTGQSVEPAPDGDEARPTLIKRAPLCRRCGVSRRERASRCRTSRLRWRGRPARRAWPSWSRPVPATRVEGRTRHV